MGGMEFNKIFAAILVAGIVAMFAGFLADEFVKPEKLKENAYAIEGVANAGAGPKVEKKAEPILALLATADIERGQKMSKACAACHNFDKGGPNGVGPNLWGVVGRPKEAKAGFSYSGALKENGASSWTYEELNKFLWKPKKYASGTKMNFAGLKKQSDRAALVAWLRTLSDSQAALPSADRIAADEAELLPAPVVEEAVGEAVEAVKAAH